MPGPARRLLLAAAILLLAGCGGGQSRPRPQSRPRLWITPTRSTKLTACLSADCGPYAATFNWAGVTIAGQTGYYVALNGSQVADQTATQYTFGGIDCGTTSTFSVEAHNGSATGYGTSGTSQPYSYSYTAPTCGGGSTPVNTAEPIASGTVATGSVVSTTNGSWTGSPSSYTYQWQHCTTDGSACTNIGGATSQAYTVASGDSGDVLVAQVTAHNGGTASSPAASPMIPFGDVFAGSSVDPNVWNVVHQHGDTTQGEFECYEPGNITVSSNQMLETITHTSDANCPVGAGNPHTLSATYQSGDVQAQTFNYAFGTLKASIKFEGGTGPWPALWMLDSAKCQQPTNLSSTGCLDNNGGAEVDIAELLSSDPTTMNEGIWPQGTGCHVSGLSNASTSFHTYELDWTSTQLVWKIDGTTKCTLNSSIQQIPAFPMIDTAIDGNVGGTINNATLPVSTRIAWIYVTTNSPDATTVPTFTDGGQGGGTVGAPKHGDVLTIANNIWGSGMVCGSGGVTCTYQWHHCDPTVTNDGYCSVLGATSQTYTLGAGDVGDFIQASVTATTASGASSASTSQTAAVG
jgi:beta-glucanase (GH16 family)